MTTHTLSGRYTMKEIAAQIGITLDADGVPEKTRQNAANALRANARMMREGPLDIAIAANEAAARLAFAAFGMGWVSRDAMYASLSSARADSQHLGIGEAYARHADRLADMIGTDNTQQVASRVFGGAQSRRLGTEVM